MAAGVNDYEVGFEAQSKQGLLMCAQPIKSGVVVSWGDMEKLWSHVIFKELRMVPENHCFVLTEPAGSSNEQKEKTLEILMETFNANSMYLGVS